jgi:PhnB protein
VALWLFVEDSDAVFNRAVSAGATVIRPVEDQFWGDRCGTLKDPHGYAWTISTRKEDLSRQEMDERAAVFFKQFAEHGQGNK